jgi:transcriptional regulator GlxA family with amidase domain
MGAAAARCCSVCAGSFVLARAGLLDRHRVVTHRANVAAVRQEHPALLMLDDAQTSRVSWPWLAVTGIEHRHA